MTLHLPRLIEIFGMLGVGALFAVVAYFATGILGFGFADSSPLGEILLALIVPITVLAFIAGAVVAYIWLV